MQIPPATALLNLVASLPAQGATAAAPAAPKPPVSPVAPSSAAAQSTASEGQPFRPMPRGSLLNITV